MRKLAGGLAFLLILVVVLTGCGAPSLDARGTAEAFLKAMENRDFVTAYTLLSLDSQATIGSSEKFQEIMNKAWADAGIQGMTIKAVQPEILSVEGTRATVPYSAEIITEDGDTVVVYNALSLVRPEEQGHWGVIWPPAH